MIRLVVGFVVGVLVWMPAFFLLASVVAFAWPAYAAHGRTWFETGVFTFESPMAVANVVCWALAALFAGWVGVAIARRRETSWTLAAVLAAYLGVLHLVLYWPSFPWWYNIGVAGLAAPAALFGGRLRAVSFAPVPRPRRRRSLE